MQEPTHNHPNAAPNAHLHRVSLTKFILRKFIITPIIVSQ